MQTIGLLIIVISGHLFVQRRPASRLKQVKHTGWDAYFHVGAWGFLFSSAAAMLLLIGNIIISLWGYGPIKIPNDFGPMISEVLKTEQLAILYWAILSCLLAWGSGWITDRQRYFEFALADIIFEDELETILYVSMAKTLPVQITTKSRKIYIGFAM